MKVPWRWYAFLKTSWQAASSISIMSLGPHFVHALSMHAHALFPLRLRRYGGTCVHVSTHLPTVCWGVFSMPLPACRDFFAECMSDFSLSHSFFSLPSSSESTAASISSSLGSSAVNLLLVMMFESLAMVSTQLFQMRAPRLGWWA